MVPDFETFYNDLVENDLWFDQMKLQHGSAQRIRDAAQVVYGEYVGNPKMFPAIENARNHIHYKLCRIPKPVKAMTTSETAPDYSENPLTDEQRKEVDKLLSDYLSQLRAKPVPQLSPEEIERLGQERPKAHPYPSTPESMVLQRELHNRWIRECFDPYTGKKNENYVDEETWLERVNNM